MICGSWDIRRQWSSDWNVCMVIISIHKKRDNSMAHTERFSSYRLKKKYTNYSERREAPVSISEGKIFQTAESRPRRKGRGKWKYWMITLRMQYFGTKKAWLQLDRIDGVRLSYLSHKAAVCGKAKRLLVCHSSSMHLPGVETSSEWHFDALNGGKWIATDKNFWANVFILPVFSILFIYLHQSLFLVIKALHREAGYWNNPA